MDVNSYQFTDSEGRPEGGHTFGRGYSISWQRGPLGRGEDRVLPNGAFVEDILEAVADRIQFYNLNGFECEENIQALEGINSALVALYGRTARREAQNVEGTHAGN